MFTSWGVIVLFLLALFAASSCMYGVSLWLASRCCKVTVVGLGRPLLACVAMSLTGVVLGVLQLGVFGSRENIAADLLFVPCGLVIMFFCIRIALRTSFWRTILVAVVFTLLGAAAGESAAWIVRERLLAAFQIPTQSQAPAFLGPHLDVQCESCALHFSVAVRSSPGTEPTALEKPAAFNCPNCGARNQVPAGKPIRSGDRILVDMTSKPKRWDEAVFRGRENLEIIHVCRLIGLPGETVEIVNGDIFINGKRLVKSPGVLPDLWIPVHDTLETATPWWKPQSPSSNWSETESGWTFSGKSGDEERLQFTGRITDELAYNAWQSFAFGGTFLVGDVELECELTTFSGDGHLALEWEFDGNRMRAAVSPAGLVELASGPLKAEGSLGSHLTAGDKLVLGYRDGQGYVLQGGRVIASLVIAAESAQALLKQRTPPSAPCRLAIVGRGTSVSISRIAVRRDVYYRYPAQGGMAQTPNPIALSVNEYYVLGDNTAASADSRFAIPMDPRLGGRYQPGAVPEETILGVARWICWPPARWHEFR